MSKLEVIPSPQLEEAGAGISFLEMILLNGILKPLFISRTNLEKNKQLFHREAEAFLACLEKAKDLDVTERVLVDRPWFVEDSSRHWSVALLCRHLSKVNFGIAKAIEGGKEAREEMLPPAAERLKAVKPEAEHNRSEEIEEFRKSVSAVLQVATNSDPAALESRTIHHPWLGDLNHIQWIAFLGFHIQVHRWQLMRMIRARS